MALGELQVSEASTHDFAYSPFPILTCYHSSHSSIHSCGQISPSGWSLSGSPSSPWWSGVLGSPLQYTSPTCCLRPHTNMDEKEKQNKHKCMCSLSWQPFLGWYWNRELPSCRSPYSARELLSRKAPYPAHLIPSLISGINFQSPFIEEYNSGLLSLQWSSIIAQIALAVAGLYIKQSLPRIEITARWPSL